MGRRLKVATTDVDPSVNPPASTTFWAEAQYIAGDDALAGNGLNNASYQQVTVGASPSFPLTRVNPFFEKQPAINAWKVKDPIVILIDVDIPGSSPIERYQVARKVTDLGGGFWHYEYAVRNHNSERNARALTVEFPVPTTFSGIGFNDVEHHSGEPYATTDWSVSTTSTAVSWFTDTFAVERQRQRAALRHHVQLLVRRRPAAGRQHRRHPRPLHRRQPELGDLRPRRAVQERLRERRRQRMERLDLIRLRRRATVER